MKNTRKIFGIVFVFALIAVMAVMIAGCKPKTPDETDERKYDMESRVFSMSISNPDGVFNPYFSTSAYDSTIAGMTQIGMLSTDYKGNIVAGENEPCVAKDYSIKEASDKSSTTYEFLIKNGIMFSDGEPLTIKDVLFNLYVYLDPAYTGSATIYSTDIKGLKNYRQQQLGDTQDASSFEEGFVTKADLRIRNLINYVTVVGRGANDEIKAPLRRDWTDAEVNSFKADYKYISDKFLEELKADWNSAEVESYKDWGFTAKWQVFMMNDGGYSNLLLREYEGGPLVKDENGNYKLNTEEAESIYQDEILMGIALDENSKNPEDMTSEELAKAIEEYCINSVYETYFPGNDITRTNYNNFTMVVRYWGTATTVLDQFTAEAKSSFFASTNKVVPNVSGITTYQTTEFNGATLDSTHDVLKIEINKVDPKAIYNFAFTVSPMHYYSTHSYNGKDYIAAFNGETEFGLEFGSIDFMNNVLNAPSKVGLPLGAGAYKASNANKGEGTVNGDTFWSNNMIYYERNEYFNTVGKELSNAKIKFIAYKVVESNQIVSSLISGDVDFGDPSATQENIDEVRAAGLSDVEIQTSGYGYVGINPRFVPNIVIRRAIMKAMNTQTIINNYYKGDLAELILRPISKTSWAYPNSATTYTSENGTNYSFDNTGYEIEEMVKAAGYVKNGKGIYHKNIDGYGDDELSYKFTIAGGSTDHPAHKMFLDAQRILNSIGFDIQVVTSLTALSDLSNGKLAVWAAAWSSGIDPDMYQIYHVDSLASSTSNWGYKQIKAGSKTEAYSEEYGIITALSELIDQGRSTTDQDERAQIYSLALDKIMEFAVEMPTYQRKDMSAFNGEVLRESSMTPSALRSPYNGLLSRIWEVEYN